MQTKKKLSMNLIVKAGVTASILGLMLATESCTKTNHVVGQQTTTPTPPPPGPSSTLTAIKISSPLSPGVVGPGASATSFQQTGAIDPQWNQAPKLTVKATVPDVEGGNGFGQYIGNSTNVTMQCLYDATNIYFLLQWPCAGPNLESSPWYFDVKSHTWKQGGAGITYDVNGIETMQSFVSDQFVFLFNINNSCADFVTQSCYGVCHQNVPVYNPADSLPTNTTWNGMHCNSPNEKLDCWRARMYQVVNENQALDYYIDYDGGVYNGNGIHADGSYSNGANPPVYSSNAGTNGTGGLSNKQSLKMLVKGTKVNVPIWLLLNDTYPNAGLHPSDTIGSNCVFVVAVDSMGVLYCAATRGGTIIGNIDPNANTTYQQVGTTIGNGNQTSWIPGKLYLPYTGDEGDVLANVYYTGSGYMMMLQRALTTADVAKEQDVDFSKLTDIEFGIGVMFRPQGSINAADNQHAIVPGLTLHFQQ